MRFLLPLLFACSLLSIATAGAAPMKLTADGIEIEGGSLGRFTFSYPLLLNEEQSPAHQLLGKDVSGQTAALTYDDGARVEVTVGPAGQLTFRLSSVPADVKNIGLEMLIPIAFNQGGKWKIGTQEGQFPPETPAKPHLYQNPAPSLTITNFEGKSLEVLVPENTFLQLTDNREWN